MNPAANLFLVGPMGAGKSTVGRLVADRLGLAFVDLDHEIEARSGAAIALIFELEGEAGFRARECAALADCTAREGIVLATGGGAILDPTNRELLRRRGYVAWLDADVETQLARLARDRSRPLLRAVDRRERLVALAAERNLLYAQVADLQLPSRSRRNSAQAAQELLAQLAQQWQRQGHGVPA
ncbi:MAG: shikimate kinase [Dokdonella sp.]|uniref:shikimate kinase n=1 Tax=Dokdonella sp. TaxID=2291710 RepID=UPI0025C0D588|nr:shikimate kinase [Dokdonella sp.]MBX3701224.1 shikimate kinase [Dokdonella sp.]